MPNWCDNVVTISNKDEQAIKRVKDSFKEGKLCNEFIPMPKELEGTVSPNYDLPKKERDRLIKLYGASNWYDFRVSNWGTKWDVGGEDGHIDNEETKNSGSSIQLTFNSAWAPPTGLYAKLIEEGYDVIAYYNESGVGFCGKYTKHGDEHYNTYDDSSNIPEDIDDMFCISESQRLDEEA